MPSCPVIYAGGFYDAGEHKTVEILVVKGGIVRVRVCETNKTYSVQICDLWEHLRRRIA